MSRLTGCSEVQEAFQLFFDLLDDPAVSARPRPTAPMVRTAGVTPSAAAVGEALQAPLDEPAATGFRGDRLDGILAAMCHRGGFSGAVVVDASGLPLAAYNSPVEVNAVAAFTAVLGDTLDRVGRFFNQPGADAITVDVNYQDKVVVRRFRARDLDLFLLLVCPQAIDERSEVELSTTQMATVLA
jgi:predicted regulator of Ras-like GTPase activity (Roadblock/LC7/MglB family)